jgi:predicted RNA-binding protein with PIN domain
MNSQYYIDGNNLIHLSKRLSIVHSKDKQSSREVLVSHLSSFFRGKKISVTVFLDGFENRKINGGALHLKYSCGKPADDDIRHAIGKAKNPKLITVVTSDGPLASFAKKCSCTIISSEDFDKQLFREQSASTEDSAINSLQNQNEEFKKLFMGGAK